MLLLDDSTNLEAPNLIDSDPEVEGEDSYAEEVDDEELVVEEPNGMQDNNLDALDNVDALDNNNNELNESENDKNKNREVSQLDVRNILPSRTRSNARTTRSGGNKLFQ